MQVMHQVALYNTSQCNGALFLVFSAKGTLIKELWCFVLYFVLHSTPLEHNANWCSGTSSVFHQTIWYFVFNQTDTGAKTPTDHKAGTFWRSLRHTLVLFGGLDTQLVQSAK